VRGEHEMNKENVRKWCQLFREGRTMGHGKAWNGDLSLAMGESKESACRTLRDRHLTEHTFFCCQSLGNDQKTKDTVQKQLKGLAVTFLDKGIPKLVPQHDKWLNLHGNWCSSSFIQALTGCNREITLKILQTLFTSFSFTFWTCYINTLP
jgi:hypothetical protein